MAAPAFATGAIRENRPRTWDQHFCRYAFIHQDIVVPKESSACLDDSRGKGSIRKIARSGFQWA